MEVQEDETPEEAMARLNEGTWCRDNLIDYIKRASDNDCLCDVAQVEFLREATADDELRHSYHNEDL